MTRPDIPADLQLTVQRALDEDIGSGDITASLIPATTRATATVVTRETAVICGRPWFDQVFNDLDPSITVEWLCAEGDEVPDGRTLCRLHGPARALLSGERTAINFLQTLSATATVARRFAARVGNHAVTLLDTRKTLPGLRTAQKYAVRCGGCTNHRAGLYDAILIKENHILALGSIAAAVAVARRQSPGIAVEIEVETLDELDQALDAGADQILLDNFSTDMMTEAVRRNRARQPAAGRPQARLEASGNVDADTLTAIAATGVDYISVGALTKNIQAIDLSMRIELVAAAVEQA